MGARVYVAELGRFLQVDPIEGGVDNNYVYTNQPVTEYDLNGMWIGAAARWTYRMVRAAPRLVPNAMRAVYNNKYVGRKSSLFGSKSLGAPKNGVFNNNNVYRFGWGKAPNGQKALRIAVGPKSWNSRIHIDLYKGRW